MKIKKIDLWFLGVIFLTLVFSNCGELNVIDNSGLKSTTDLGTSVGISWTNQATTNITLSPSGNWDSVDINDPVVIKKGTTYYMWYSGKSTDGKWRIGEATSTDGVNWTKNANNPLIVPSDSTASIDYKGVRVCSVLYDSTEKTYKMWLRGYAENNASLSSSYYVCSIIYASASVSDKDTWYKYPANSSNPKLTPSSVLNITSSNISATTNYGYCLSNYYPIGDANQDLGKLSVCKEEYYINSVLKTLYVMWFTRNSTEGSDYTPVISSAFSYNETGFTKNALDTLINISSTIFAAGYTMPTVIKDYYNNKLVYKMWFIDGDSSKSIHSTGYAIGFTDGQLFTPMYFDKGVAAGIFTVGLQSSGADAKGISNESVIRDDDRYKMWYIGRNTSQVPQVCYMESLAN